SAPQGSVTIHHAARSDSGYHRPYAERAASAARAGGNHSEDCRARDPRARRIRAHQERPGPRLNVRLDRRLGAQMGSRKLTAYGAACRPPVVVANWAMLASG